MGFREKLRKASFKDIPFFVSDSELLLGRKTIVHTFPDKDDPDFIEDQGRDTRIYNLTAFVVDEDYFPIRDRLIQACEDKEIGVLIHPYYGKRKVKLLGKASISESTLTQGMATFTLSFSETEVIKFPTIRVNPIRQLITAVTDFINGINETLEDTYDILNKPAAILDESLSILDAAIDTLDTVKKISNIDESYQAALDKLKARINLLQLTASGISDDFLGLFQVSGGDVSTAPETITGVDVEEDQNVLLNNIEENILFIENRNLDKILGTDPNTVALNEFITQVAIGGAVNSVINIEFESSNQATEIQDKLVEQIDIQLDSQTNDDSIDNLSDLKTALIQDTVNRGNDLPFLRDIILPATTDALSLTHKLYNDIDRIDDILDRNNLLHPGFIPGNVTLEVLSE